VTGTRRKKRIDSKSSDRTMPTVVSTATDEPANRNPLTAFSTLAIALNSGRTRRQAQAAQASASTSTRTTSEARAAWRSER